MEGYFDALTQPNSREVLTDPALLEMLAALTDYYEKGQWLEDYQADEQGLLPEGLKRGVLSEDGLWNLLCDIDISSGRGYNRTSEQKEETL